MTTTPAATASTSAASNIFLPFWNLFAAIFVYYLFVEGLKKLGLIKEGKSK